MLDCIVLGDSIAVGLGQARPDCDVVAVSGITSERYVHTLLAARQARTAIISLGVNDREGMTTADNLQRLRGTITADIVYWLLVGSNPRMRDAVRSVADRYSDRLIDVAPLAGPDHIHPDSTGYAKLAEQTGGTVGAGLRLTSTTQHLLSTEGDFRAFPNMKVWNGPDNLNGVPMHTVTRP